MPQKTYVTLLHITLWISFALFTIVRGKNNCTHFFIFICPVVVLCSLYVMLGQLPCGIATVDCDMGVNLSAAHLLCSEIISI